MSNTKFTPGEWKFVLEGGFVIAPAVKKEDSLTAKGEFGEDCWKHYGGELVCETVSQADGQLIATAPDLLAALKAIQTWSWSLPNHLREDDVWRKIDSTIQKALPT